MIRGLLPTACGLLMVAAAASRADGPELALAAGAAAVVVLGAVWRPAATIAVLATVAVIVVSDPAPTFTALAGLAAAAYLLLRHGEHAVTPPSMVAAAGFAAVATMLAALPVHVPWLPLLAPAALLGGYLVALRPFLPGPPDR